MLPMPCEGRSMEAQGLLQVNHKMLSHGLALCSNVYIFTNNRNALLREMDSALSFWPRIPLNNIPFHATVCGGGGEKTYGRNLENPGVSPPPLHIADGSCHFTDNSNNSDDVLASYFGPFAFSQHVLPGA